MSKKNKNKNRFKANYINAGDSVASNENAPKVVLAKGTNNEQSNDLKKEFKNLALTILFILAILVALYYYDQQSQILDQMTNKLFELFK